MTLEQVMALDGTALNEAVALRLGWQCFELNNLPAWKRPDGTITNPFHIPDFANDWSAAMQIRDSINRQATKARIRFHMALTDCVLKRLDQRVCIIALDAIPADYARAALLVGE